MLLCTLQFIGFGNKKPGVLQALINSLINVLFGLTQQQSAFFKCFFLFREGLTESDVHIHTWQLLSTNTV